MNIMERMFPSLTGNQLLAIYKKIQYNNFIAKFFAKEDSMNNKDLEIEIKIKRIFRRIQGTNRRIKLKIIYTH